MKKKSKAMLIISVILMSLAIGAIWMVTAEDDVDRSIEGEYQSLGYMWMARGLRSNSWGVLSEEQRSELASEIQNLITEKFEEWGLEPPQFDDLPARRFGGGCRFGGRGFIPRPTE